MSYHHDIFISYRRNPETYAWIKEHFVPLLTLRVELELGRKPSVYVDDQIESGTSWPASLGAALGGSRVLIALWSGNYLTSVWYTEELSHPAFIHDGEKFPPDLRHIQHFEVQKCFNVRMARNSPRAEDLDPTLAAQAPAIATCIDKAPTWR